MREPLSLETISELCRTAKIRQVQIDPNTACACKCWFCPVAYYPRPSETLMTKEGFRKILGYLAEGVSAGLIIPDFALWLSSYYDILVETVSQ